MVRLGSRLLLTLRARCGFRLERRCRTLKIPPSVRGLVRAVVDRPSVSDRLRLVTRASIFLSTRWLSCVT